jgi:RND family efflux transporter MFP subunit
VIVTTPVRGEVTDYQDFTGRLDGIKTVDIRPRVSGFVVSAPFKEGDLVHEGDLLFEIDPQTYQADVNLAAANVKLAKADQNLQQRIAARAKDMIKSRSVSQEEYDTAVATWEKSQATVEAMGAARDRAQLYLGYTHVLAPQSGRISRRFVDPGNLVNADNTILTTIVSDSQLYAYFDVDERTYLDLVGHQSTGQTSWLHGLQFPVMMRLANEEEFTRSGTINFIDNRVNAGTGTIRMRAVFDNSQGLLRAGLFVRIRLPVGAPYETLLIPAEALMSDQGRHNVYVVNDKNEVEYRAVELGQEVHGLRAIKKNLSPGERVIVSGMQRVRPGPQKDDLKAKIMENPPKPPDSPLGRLLGANRPPHQGSGVRDQESGVRSQESAKPAGLNP